MILNSGENGIVKNELLKIFIDSGKLMCELFKQLTKARKAFIYPDLEKKARQLLGNASTDDLLFGSELLQRIKTTKEVEKVGLTLKPLVPEKKVFPRPQTFKLAAPAWKSSESVAGGLQTPSTSRNAYRQLGKVSNALSTPSASNNRRQPTTP